METLELSVEGEVTAQFVGHYLLVPASLLLSLTTRYILVVPQQWTESSPHPSSTFALWDTSPHKARSHHCFSCSNMLII